MFSTTADGASSPTERMRIADDGLIRSFSSASSSRFTTSQGAGTAYSLFIGAYSATSVSDGTDSFRVYSNGNVVNTNNSYTGISDIKLKENIVDAGSQWDDLKALRVRKYNLKEGQTHTQIGLVAQEVEPISPGLVYETPDRDADGNDLGTTTKAVQYSVLYMKAVKALQEAMERIEVLEQRLADAHVPPSPSLIAFAPVCLLGLLARYLLGALRRHPALDETTRHGLLRSCDVLTLAHAFVLLTGVYMRSRAARISSRRLLSTGSASALPGCVGARV
jgi:hypothetical protein